MNGISRALARSRVHRAYRDTFSTEAGQRVLDDLIAFSSFADDPMVPGAPDATAYNVGMQRVVRRILSFLHRSEADLEKRAMQLSTEDEE